MTEEAAPQPAAAVRSLAPVASSTGRAISRHGRKHRQALTVLALYHLLFFFPTLFMGRMLSPNDLLSHYEPWATLRPAQAQNATLDAAATGIQPALAAARRDPSSFHWNRYLACGIPGFGAWATISPFLLLPSLLLPLAALYSGIILAKLEFSFFFAYLWLREERMGKRGAAIGAMTFAGAGIYSVWWLMHPTNATVLYPALLLVTSRLFRRKRIGILGVVALACCAAVAGFPAMVAYGAWAIVSYAIFLALRRRMVPIRALLSVLGGVILAAAICAPLIVPFLRFVRQTGYVESRAAFSTRTSYPLSHFKSFVDPWRLGDPAAHLWTGDPALGYSDDFVESCIYVGLLALPLALIGLFRRRSPARWFWLAFALVVVASIFGLSPVSRMVSGLPGIKFSPLSRLRVLLPIAVAYLSASGVALIDSARRSATALVRHGAAALLALVTLAVPADLALFAARFYPYLPRAEARLPESETLRFLQKQTPPFRILPFFTYLYPNTAEMAGLEDIRSHFSSEADYRALLLRIDPTVWDTPTVLLFNDLKSRVSDPLLSMLNVRYLIEQRNIDILRWTIYSATTPGVVNSGALRMLPGDHLQRTIAIGQEPFYSVEVPVSFERSTSPAATMSFILNRPATGQVIYRRDVAGGELARTAKVYLPLFPRAGIGEVIQLRIESKGIQAVLARGAAPEGEDPLYFGRVTIPILIDREFSDGRLFLNLVEVPRFHAVWNVERGSRDEILRRTDIDYGRTAIAADELAPELGKLSAVPRAARAAAIRIDRYGGANIRLTTRSAVPFFLATSEKVSPDLTVEVDGREVTPTRINLLFAGLPMAPGTHHIEFRRRLGRKLWPLAAAGLLLTALAVGAERRRGAVSPPG
jgi:hypothetical protein